MWYGTDTWRLGDPSALSLQQVTRPARSLAPGSRSSTAKTYTVCAASIDAVDGVISNPSSISVCPGRTKRLEAYAPSLRQPPWSPLPTLSLLDESPGALQQVAVLGYFATLQFPPRSRPALPPASSQPGSSTPFSSVLVESPAAVTGTITALTTFLSSSRPRTNTLPFHLLSLSVARDSHTFSIPHPPSPRFIFLSPRCGCLASASIQAHVWGSPSSHTVLHNTGCSYRIPAPCQPRPVKDRKLLVTSAQPCPPPPLFFILLLLISPSLPYLFCFSFPSLSTTPFDPTR